MKVRAFFLFILTLFVGGIFWMQSGFSQKKTKTLNDFVQNEKTVHYILNLMADIKNRLEKDEDSFPDLIKKTETGALNAADPRMAALLHSMSAEMYKAYYENNRRDISRRTPLAGYIPEDIREWTENLFADTVKAHLKASLLPAELLQRTDMKAFDKLLEKGKDRKSIRPTLFDFLVYRAVEIQPAAEWYEQLLAFRRTQPQKQALMMAELEALDFHFSTKREPAYAEALDSLLMVYEKEPFAAEIYIRKVALLEQSLNAVSADTDSIRAMLYKLCTEGISRYPTYPGIAKLNNKRMEMEAQKLSFRINKNICRGKELEINLDYKNISRVTLSVYQSSFRPDELWRNWQKSGVEQRGKCVMERTIDLPLVNSYTQMQHRFTIPMETWGVYECVLSVPKSKLKVSDFFTVSDLGVLMRNRTDQSDILVLHPETGKPVEGATVLFYSTDARGNPVRTGEGTSDHFGIVSVPEKPEITLIRPIMGADSASFLSSFRNRLSTSRFDQTKETEETEIAMFTDRYLYRPGQPIYFKGIAYVKNTDSPYLITGRKFTVVLRDANNKEIATQTCTANDFGSFNGEFMIPQKTLNGSFTLSVKEQKTFIRVEEYKRPTFTIDFLPVEEELSFGNPMQITAEAKMFSGLPVQAGMVTWTISRRLFWWPFYQDEETGYGQLATGTATTDKEGRFTVSFTPQPVKKRNYQTYEVHAVLTDSKGETQDAYFSFSVGDCGIILSPQIKNRKMERESAAIRVVAYTVNGKPIETEGSYTIRKLSDEQKETMADESSAKHHNEGKTVLSGRFKSGWDLPSEALRALASGRYRLEVKAIDSKGKEAVVEQEFLLYSLRDKHPPVFTHTWMIEKKTECFPGDTAEILFGTSDQEAYVLYEIFDRKGMLKERKRVLMSNECRMFRIPFKETDGEGFFVLFFFLKAGKIHMEQLSVYRRKPDRSLKIHTETFRDRLLPGSKENWKFRILDADSVPVSAELLAGMYDASLDEILPFSWYFYPVRKIRLSAPTFSPGITFSSGGDLDVAPISYQKVPDFRFDKLKWPDGISFFFNSGFFKVRLKSDMMVLEGMPRMVNDTVEEMNSKSVDMEERDEESSSSPQSGKKAEVRRNFAETAFFYPVLMTDKEGMVSFGFTLPESNTTWKLQLLAQTKDLKYGYSVKTAVSNKPLMVSPNLPRFLRQGDKVTVSSQISNRSERLLEGVAHLELFDPENEQPVLCLTKSQKGFTLPKDSMLSVNWSFTVPASSNGLVGCRIIAETEEGSDGEQHLIPVLPSEIPVTESMPFFLSDKNEETVRIERKEGIRPFRLTFEVTANPIWYAVQALPTLATPENDNIISWSAAYYVNTLAARIARSHPRIKNSIDRWIAEGGTASTLLSNLEKNQELKNILLQETPWVLEGQNEMEQKQRLSLLFDLNRISGQREAAMNQLMQQQSHDGGWGWFKGMYSSWGITLFVLQGMISLQELQAVEYSAAEREMQLKALRFLDKNMEEMYQWQLNEKQTFLPAGILDYLLIRTAFPNEPMQPKTRQAVRSFTDLAWKRWEKQTLYDKGTTARLMWRIGRKKEADAILRWLRKTATISAEKGMYWENNRRNGFWNSPLETHSLLMALFHDIDPDSREINRMKQWLINQKRTQHWESTPATVSAIYALLLTGSDWFTENNRCEIRWNGQTYSTAEGETTTGYRKVSLTQEQLGSEQKETVVSIVKTGIAPAWGAVYLQYFQSIDRIEKQKGVLNVEKKLFIEVLNRGKTEIIPVTPDRPLQVGDKVLVRLVVRSDREMNYVFLNDLRAGCFEPEQMLSGSVYQDGVWLYRTVTDVAQQFFIERLPQGTYVLEYSAYVSRSGSYSGGISTIQCLYAPEFVSHTEGTRVEAIEKMLSLQQ